MRILTLLAPTILKRLLRTQSEASEATDRLVIAVRRQQLRLDELSADIERVSDRLCRTEGRVLGGRRPKLPPGAPTSYERFEDVPPHDKAALREWFKAHPPKKDQEH